MSSSNPLSSTVAKCLQTLQLIADHAATNKNRGLTLTDISRSTGFSTSTTYRYLQTLEEFHLVRRDRDGNYSLGTRIVELYHIYLNSHDLRGIALDDMNDLAEATQETIYLGVLEGLEVFYLDRIESPLPIGPRTRIGERNRLYCTGLGKAILAFSPESLLQQVIERGLARRTEHTITDPDALRADLKSTRERGFSWDNMENEEYVKCVAAPIYNSARSVIAAISISGTCFRMDDSRMMSELGPMVAEAGARISRKLGYMDPSLTDGQWKSDESG